MTTKWDNCQLELDQDRGVLYVHSAEGITLVRVCCIPKIIIGKGNVFGLIDIVYDRELAKGFEEK